MKRQHPPVQEEWENDPVWNLVDQAPPPGASGRFVDDTVRAARLSQPSRPWSHKFWAIASLSTGLTGAAAALVLSLYMESPSVRPHHPIVETTNPAQEIQEIAETEILIAAVDHMDEFSDKELVSLIGF